MKSDFDLIVHTIPDKDVKLYAISDVHLGAAEHKEREWNAFCNSVAGDPNAYIILAGDMINNATRSSVSNIFEETMRPQTQKRLMTEMLTPLRDKILCAVPGNHERRSLKDADDEPMYDIMCKLDIEDLYRPNLAFLKLQLGNENRTELISGRKRPCYSICVTHGSGGGIYTGAAVNRNERFGYVMDGIDLLIVGHTHKPFVTQPQKIVVDVRNNIVKHAPFKVVSTSSWLDFGGYAAQKMLLPSSYAPQIIILSSKGKEIRVIM